VRSILGRYLEHSRIFRFENGGDPLVFIGSADMMHRNLDRRVEALVRLTSPAHIAELDELFDLAMSDGTSSWWLDADGQWTRHDRDDAGEALVDLQNDLMRQIGSRRRTGTR
jgi:polyphosphate kinase